MRSTLLSLLTVLVLSAPGCAASPDSGGLVTADRSDELEHCAEAPHATSGSARHDTSCASNAVERPSLGRIGSHGMVVAGTPAEAFLSHIPMFGPPHDVQLVVAGAFSALDGAPLSSPAFPASFNNRLFTFLPDRMSLDALRTGALDELRGTLFLGNFEAGGRPFRSRVRFVVTRVVHQHVLDASASQPEIGYVVFGSRARTFAVHYISGAPSFDEVLRVELDGDAPSDSELASGVDTRLANTEDAETRRLGIATAPARARTRGHDFTIRALTTLSCLEGPDFTAPCAELAAGER